MNMDPRRSSKRVQNPRRPQRRATVSFPASLGPAQPFPALQPQWVFQTAHSSPSTTYATVEPMTQANSTNYLGYPSTGTSTPYDHPVTQDPMAYPSDPVHNVDFQQFNRPPNTATALSTPVHQGPFQVFSSGLAYRPRLDSTSTSSSSGTSPSMATSNVSGAYYPPSSSRTTPGLTNTPIVSASPTLFAMGTWTEGHQLVYPPVPTEDQRGRVNERLKIKDFPGKSIRSDSTEVQRSDSHSREEENERRRRRRNSTSCRNDYGIGQVRRRKDDDHDERKHNEKKRREGSRRPETRTY